MELGFLFISIFKIAAIVAYIYGLLWVLNRRQLWAKIVGAAVAFGIIQAALMIKIGNVSILNNFDSGLLFQSATMAMVALGLNLIYGFNGQFSLGQWGFYGIGAYTAADITYRWVNRDPKGLLVIGLGVILGGLAIMGIGKFLQKYRRVPVLSAFTLYLLGSIAAGAIAYYVGHGLEPMFAPLMGTKEAPGMLMSPAVIQVVFFFAILLAGAFAAEVGFLFGLPVLSLGSDYFGIATLGFAIIVNTLMVNSDTILPFPEMKGGRGMIGIPKLTNWFWAFLVLVIVIVIMRNLVQSSNGRSILSVREDETAAKTMGIDVTNTKIFAFVMGSFFAGLGGAVYAHFIGFLSPGTFNFLAGFNPLIIVVFGGLGSMTGTVVSSFGWIFFLEGMLRVLLGQLGTEAPTWRFVLYPITLLLLMLLRPQGLLGTLEWGFFRSPLPKKREETQVVSSQ